MSPFSPSPPAAPLPICMPLFVTITDLMFRKIFELLRFDKLHVEMAWCGSEGSYGDFYLWDI